MFRAVRLNCDKKKKFWDSYMLFTCCWDYFSRRTFAFSSEHLQTMPASWSQIIFHHPIPDIMLAQELQCCCEGPFVVAWAAMATACKKALVDYIGAWGWGSVKKASSSLRCHDALLLARIQEDIYTVVSVYLLVANAFLFMPEEEPHTHVCNRICYYFLTHV